LQTLAGYKSKDSKLNDDNKLNIKSLDMDEHRKRL